MVYDDVEVAIRDAPSFGHPARLVVQPSRVITGVGQEISSAGFIYVILHGLHGQSTHGYSTLSQPGSGIQIGKRKLVHLLPLLHRHRGFQPYYATSPRSCSECPWVNRHGGSDQVITKSLPDFCPLLALLEL